MVVARGGGRERNGELLNIKFLRTNDLFEVLKSEGLWHSPHKPRWIHIGHLFKMNKA